MFLFARPLAIAVVTASLGALLYLYECHRRRRRRMLRDGTSSDVDGKAMSSACTTSVLSSAASVHPPGAPTESNFEESASNSLVGLINVTASQQWVTDIRTEVVCADQEELVVPESADTFSAFDETLQTGEASLPAGSPFDEHSYCMPRGSAAESSIESVTSDCGTFSSYEVLSVPKREIAEGALNVVACEEVVESSAINSTQEDRPTNASADSSHSDFEPSLAKEQSEGTSLVEAGTTFSNSVPAESLKGDLLVGWVHVDQQQEQVADGCLQHSDSISKHCLSALSDALKSDASESVIAGDTSLDGATDPEHSRGEQDERSLTFDVNSGSVQDVIHSAAHITTMQYDSSWSLESSAFIKMVRTCNGENAVVEIVQPLGLQVPMPVPFVSEDLNEHDKNVCMLNTETDSQFVNFSGMPSDPDNYCERDVMRTAQKSELMLSSAASDYSDAATDDETANCSEHGRAATHVNDGLRQFTVTGDAADVISTPIRDDAAAFTTSSVLLDVASNEHGDSCSECATCSETNILSESHASSVRSTGDCSSPSKDNDSLTIADENCAPAIVNHLLVTLPSESSVQLHSADTSAFDAACDQQVAEYVLHDSSSFVSSSAVSASSDSLSLVTHSPERVNDIQTVITSVQESSIGRHSNSELRSGDGRQNGNERVFKFYLPTAMCGLFIGKKGRNVNQLKAKSGAYIHVEALPTARDMHLCVVRGIDSAVTKAINAIVERFPQLEAELNAQLYPASVAASPCAVDVSHLQLQLVPQTPVNVLLANVAASTRVFLQLPTHPTFTSLERLSANLLDVYSGAAAGELPPLLEEPVIPGSLCAVESDGVWYRGLIIQQLNPCTGEGSCMQLRYLDYGGYDMVPLARIRQLRADFLTLPFQAVECTLAHVKPQPDADSLGESNAVATLASFTGYVLECINIGPDCDTGLPSVELYANNNGVAVYINQVVSGTGGMEWLSDDNAIH